MPRYEYKVIPAPLKGQKAKGVRSTQARFANAVEIVMNEQAAEGWEYQRTDTLPCEERQGLRARVTVFQNLLVFRRTLQKAAEPVLPAETATVAVLPLVQEVLRRLNRLKPWLRWCGMRHRRCGWDRLCGGLMLRRMWISFL